MLRKVDALEREIYRGIERITDVEGVNNSIINKNIIQADIVKGQFWALDQKVKEFDAFMHRPENVVEQLIEKGDNEVIRMLMDAMDMLKGEVMNSISDQDDNLNVAS